MSRALPSCIHLRACSEYSLLHSCARIDDLASETVQQGMPMLGVADRDGLFGLHAVRRALESRGLRPVIGLSVNVADETVGATRTSLSARRLVVYPESEQGYRSLLQLASACQMHVGGRGPHVTWDDLRAHAAGLIALTGGVDGIAATALLQHDKGGARRVLSQLCEVYGRNAVYVELCRQGHADERPLVQALAELASEARLPVVATAEIRHVRAEQVRYMDALAAVADGLTLEDAARGRQGALYHLRTAEEMRQLFEDERTALERTWEVAQRIVVPAVSSGFRLPRFPCPPGHSEAQMLREQAHTGLRERLPRATDAYVQRLDHELEIIQQMGFSGYFLIVWDFVRFAREAGITVGPGRGSAAGSLVAYALSITDVDPLRYQLLFERFLNPERVTWPDIDIDFDTDRRHEVITYVARRHGMDRVAQIGALGTLAARAALRDMGRVLGAAPADINRLVAKIPATPGTTLAQVLAADASAAECVRTAPSLARVVEYARAVEGLPRHATIHAAGVVIADVPLVELVPLSPGPDGTPVTQFSMADVEALGLLKMDFLGLRTLNLCDRTLRYVCDVRGAPPREPGDEIDDRTAQLLARGDTDGCFQLESEGVKQVLRDMRPTALEDLIAVISLYRPGPMDQIPAYLAARSAHLQRAAAAKDEGGRAVTAGGPAAASVPELEDILAPTYGIIVYQEQIMQIAARMAGFSLGAADVLRRAVAKKQRDALERERERFVRGCLAMGHRHDVAEQVYDLIVRFADYGFNRSHAAAYAMLALRTAQLKANHRAEFTAALIADVASRPEKVAQYALAARRAGVPVLSPDVNRSLPDTAPERLEDGRVGIRLGLFTVKNVGQAAVNGLLTERERGVFTSLADILERCDRRAVAKRALESLICAGACDAFGVSRATLLQQLERLAVDRGAGRQVTFPGLSASADVAVPSLADDPDQRDEWERELIGFVVSRDPYEEVTLAQALLGARPLRESCGQDGWTGPAQVVARVAHVRSLLTKRGEPMAFVTLEDATATVICTIFPSVYRLLPSGLAAGTLVSGSIRCEAKDDRPIAIRLTPWQPHLCVRVGRALEGDRAALQRLRTTMQRAHAPSGSPVALWYESGKIRRLAGLTVALTPQLTAALEEVVGKGAVRIV
jgi:DNA polymerase-3 subunit alpha